MSVPVDYCVCEGIAMVLGKCENGVICIEFVPIFKTKKNKI
jgi:hypothetical protein